MPPDNDSGDNILIVHASYELLFPYLSIDLQTKRLYASGPGHHLRFTRFAWYEHMYAPSAYEFCSLSAIADSCSRKLSL